MPVSSRVGRIFVVSAPSGAGKTRLVTEVISRVGINYSLSRVVTYTTRKPRFNEIDGRDYYFLPRDAFLEKQTHHFFLEVTSFNGNLYGSPAHVLDDVEEGKSYIFITDLPGAHSIRQYIPDSCLIWIIPPDLSILRKRLMGRGSDLAHEVEQRLNIAAQEIAQEEYERFFDYHLINDNLYKAVEDFEAIIIHEIKRDA